VESLPSSLAARQPRTEIKVQPDDYISAAEALLQRAEIPRDRDAAAAAYRAEAQVTAIQAVAAAIDRLAAAVEALPQI
jgi:hypothetical protein